MSSRDTSTFQERPFPYPPARRAPAAFPPVDDGTPLFGSDHFPNDRRAYGDPAYARPHQRLTRKYTRQQQPIGQIRIGGNTLSKQFQRRYKRLVSQIDSNSPELSGQKKRLTTFDDVYRTIRQRFDVASGQRHPRALPYPPPQAYHRQY